MNSGHGLLAQADQLHTTELGVVRISRNLSLAADDVVDRCKDLVKAPDAVITRKGKNWYVDTAGVVITINASSLTIITAHQAKR